MPRHLPGIKAVTFDAGGTLLYTYPSIGAIYHEVMRHYGIGHGPEEIEAAFEKSFAEAIRDSNGNGTSSDWHWWRYVVGVTMAELGEPTDFDAMFAELWDAFAHPDRWRLYDGAGETMRLLRERGYRVALLSNWDDRLRGLLEGLGIMDHFDTVVISCEVGAEKPAAAIFEATQTELGLAPHEILHIGDSEHHDYNGARSVGWECLLVDYAGKLDGKADVIRRLEEVLEYLPGCQAAGMTND